MIHVYPLNDLKPHDTESTTCECGVKVEFEDQKTGEAYSEAIIIHSSFDGRERKSIWGYFSYPGQEYPEFDPGFEVDCPVCRTKLERPVVTVSLMIPKDSRSYFYRMHRQCRKMASSKKIQEIESRLIDHIAIKGNLN